MLVSGTNTDQLTPCASLDCRFNHYGVGSGRRPQQHAAVAICATGRASSTNTRTALNVCATYVCTAHRCGDATVCALYPIQPLRCALRADTIANIGYGGQWGR